MRVESHVQCTGTHGLCLPIHSKAPIFVLSSHLHSYLCTRSEPCAEVMINIQGEPELTREAEYRGAVGPRVV